MCVKKVMRTEDRNELEKADKEMCESRCKKQLEWGGWGTSLGDATLNI